MKDTAVASRYALALFETARQRGHEEAVAQGLFSAVSVLRQSDKLGSVLQHPLLSCQDKKRLLLKALGEKYSPLFEDFIELLLERKRLNMLPWIAQQFDKKSREVRGEVKAKVVSAIPISDSQEKSLERILSEATEKKVTVDVSVDPNILGGLVIRIEDKVLDHSIMGQLRRMREHIFIDSGSTE